MSVIISQPLATLAFIETGEEADPVHDVHSEPFM